MISIARMGDTHLCPIPGHGTSPIVSASPDVKINFLGAARVGDVCGCGAVITTGFPSIIIDYLPLAHVGSATSHGGKIVSGSPDTFGGFQFSGMATAVIVDFAKLGAVRPDGSVDAQLMAELLADPQLEQRALLSGARVQPTAAVAPLTPELIAVAGSQHDTGSANKMMFIAQAVRELAEFKRNKPAVARTLVVFTAAYNEEMLKAARSSAAEYGADFINVSSFDELIDYLNRGKDRQQSPIEHLSLFSHGVPQRIAFGYQLTGDFQMSLDVMSYSRISPAAFSHSAQVDSYACRTGMGNRSDFPIEEGIQFFPQTNESLAQLLANHLHIKVRAFVRRSDYKNTWGSFLDRRVSQACSFSGNKIPAEEWCEDWGKLNEERELKGYDHHFVYQSSGASHPVISGDTPIGAPGGHIEFSPK